MKIIPLTQGFNSLVDEEDYLRLVGYKWKIIKSRGKLYAARSLYLKGTWKTIYMHREILKPKPNLTVDHINGNSLDNRKINLREATRSQNSANKKSKGFYKHGNKYRVLVANKVIGSFETEKEAETAYREAKKARYGEFIWEKG